MFIALASHAHNLAGRRIGRLVVLGPVERRYYENGRSIVIWLCRCDCGSEVSVQATHLMKGTTASCGCLKRDTKPNLKHGHSSVRYGRATEYTAWLHMKDRCANTKRKDYHRYGGRGVTVCDRWLNSYENFLADMGRRPPDKHSLDRYPDNDGNYEPSNCRWGTSEQQGNNRCDNIRIEAFGRSQTLAQWAREHGLSMQTLWKRLRCGVPPEKALLAPSRRGVKLKP